MKKVLVKDLVIPAGTIFTDAPVKTIRNGECGQAVIGLTKNTIGFLEYYFDDDKELLMEWFCDTVR